MPSRPNRKTASLASAFTSPKELGTVLAGAALAASLGLYALAALGVAARVIPMSDAPVRTKVLTAAEIADKFEAAFGYRF